MTTSGGRRGGALAGRTFRSFRTPNFRRFFTGTAVSATGQWLQMVAQGWLVLELTDSGIALGTVTALQFLPILVGGAWGGVIADRFDKRRILTITQSLAALLASVLGLAVLADVATIGLVYVLAFSLGCVNAIDNPTRRSFVAELVPAADISNAVSLNTSVMTTARIAGPSLAGLLINTVGLAICFFLNAASFVAVLLALWRIDPDELHGGDRQPRAPGQIRAGLRYVMSTPDLRLALIMTGVISVAAFNYQVVMPMFAQRVFDGDAGTFGLLLSAASIGSLLGSLFTAGRVSVDTRFTTIAAFAFGVTMTVAALSPTLLIAYVLVVPMGAAGAAFVASANAVLQTAALPEYRGRVMALYSVVFLGSTPIGGPIIGALAEGLGARWGFIAGGVTSLVTATVVALLLLAARRRADDGVDKTGGDYSLSR